MSRLCVAARAKAGQRCLLLLASYGVRSVALCRGARPRSARPAAARALCPLARGATARPERCERSGALGKRGRRASTHQLTLEQARLSRALQSHSQWHCRHRVANGQLDARTTHAATNASSKTPSPMKAPPRCCAFRNRTVRHTMARTVSYASTAVTPSAACQPCWTRRR